MKHLRALAIALALPLAAFAERVPVVDPLDDVVEVFDTETGETTRHQTAATPVAATFLGDDLYVLARDARVLQHIGGPDIPVSPDAAFLGTSSESKLYVYARTGGVIEEIENDRVVRRLSVPPFASDLEIDGTTAYLAYPRDARIRVVDLREMKVTGELAVGAVPVDIAIAGGGTALTARILAVADPSAKRVWLTESTQSTAKAVARGFLRGFLGLGLFSGRGSQFPTGVDRVWIRGRHWIAYDTSTRTLYSFTKKKSAVVARDVALDDFVVTDEGVVFRSGMSVAQTGS